MIGWAFYYKENGFYYRNAKVYIYRITYTASYQVRRLKNYLNSKFIA